MDGLRFWKSVLAGPWPAGPVVHVGVTDVVLNGSAGSFARPSVEDRLFEKIALPDAIWHNAASAPKDGNDDAPS